MCGFRHNESLGADVTIDCKGYIGIKDDAGLLINQRPMLRVSSMPSSDGDAECMKEARKCRRDLRDINKKTYCIKNPTAHQHHD